MSNPSSAVPAAVPISPLVENGTIAPAWMKWFQNINRTIFNAFTPQGALQPAALPATQPTPTPLTAAVTQEIAYTGSAAALPAAPVGYLQWTINGTTYVVPYYAATF